MTNSPRPDSRPSNGLSINARRTLEVPYSLAACVECFQHLPLPLYETTPYELKIIKQSDTHCDLIIRVSASFRPVAKNGAATIFCALSGDEAKTRIDMTAFPSKDGVYFGCLGLVFALPFLYTFVLCGRIIFGGVALNNPLICEAAFIGFVGLFTPLCLGLALTMHRRFLDELADCLQRPEAYAEAKP